MVIWTVSQKALGVFAGAEAAFIVNLQALHDSASGQSL